MHQPPVPATSRQCHAGRPRTLSLRCLPDRLLPALVFAAAAGARGSSLPDAIGNLLATVDSSTRLLGWLALAGAGLAVLFCGLVAIQCLTRHAPVGRRAGPLALAVALVGTLLMNAVVGHPDAIGEWRVLALADGLVEGIDDLSGVVTLQGALSGTLAAARVRGELKLRDGQMFIGAVGVRLEDWRMTLKDRADGMLELNGSARSGPGRVQIVGRIRPTGTAGKRGAAAPTAELHITGNDFRSVNLPEAEVLTHPQLRLTARQRRVVIDGAVHIPQARIEPRDRGGAVAPSRDVLRVDAQVPPTSAGWQVDSHVRLTLGERVTFKGFGLRGRVGGALTVISEPDKQPRARGELVLHDGIYGAYGQELKIERGRALFRDSPLDNPGIDVRATRTSGEVVAGVRMLGTVREPRTELYSKPPLPQADVLSYLLLGRPLAGASGGEGEMLYRAASTLGLKGGAQVAQSIGRRFGIDEVALAGSELETAALTLGKYLSPRLYLNYSIGLLEAADKLRVRYQLTKHLSVQTEAGAATGGDVLYLLER